MNRGKAVSFIFDMDGVLLDTEQIAMDSWKGAFADFGFDAPDEILRSTIGIGLMGTIDICKKHFGDLPYENIAERRFRIGDEIIKNYGIPVKPGIPELLSAVKNVAHSVGVATSTPIDMAKHRLKRSGLFDEFDKVIGGDMIKHGKPAPDIYLAAAAALNVSPTACVAVEDSGPGIHAASAAGLSVVFVEDLIVPDKNTLNLCKAMYKSASDLLEHIEYVVSL